MNGFVYRLNDDEKRIINGLTMEQICLIFELFRLRFVLENGAITGIEV